MKKIKFENRLSIDQLSELVGSWSTAKADRNYRYYVGDNPTIVDRKVKDINAPDNKVPISYARKIINTVVGYMYKPGCITYTADDESYNEALTEIFDANNEPLKTAQLGKDASIYGQGYEIHYIDKDGGRLIPRFATIPVSAGMPIYNYDIEPRLVAFLYLVSDGQDEELSVYYDNSIERYSVDRRDAGIFAQKLGRSDTKIKLTPIGEEAHAYGDVPVVIAYNNKDELGDFDPVIKLIDAYDILMSDSMNEFDRFAWAYLILNGLQLDDDVARKIKDMRAFELMTNDGNVDFLTKDINSDFIDFMSRWVRTEIHKQSHVPDFLEKTGDQISGVAISKLLYDFEFIAATKQAMFEMALQRRIGLISRLIERRVLSNTSISNISNVEIVFARNKPDELMDDAELIGKYSGFVSQKTLLANFAPFVKNVDDELERLEAERPEFDIDQGFSEESTG